MAGSALPDTAGGVRPPLIIYAPHARTGSDGLLRLTLAVDGVSCANCIRKIERTLANDPAVHQARLNLSTRRLMLVWEGEPAQADRLAHMVEDLGYPVRPFSEQAPATTADSRFLLLCLAVAGFAAGNIMLLSFALWMTDASQMGSGMRAFMHWISALIAIPTVLFSGRPFFRSALAVLRRGHTNMDVPISVGIILTTGISLFETLNHGEHAYFDSVVMLIFFLLIGRYLDHRARAQARSAASELLQMMSGAATITENGSARVVAIQDIKPGMRLRVVMGERIAADGVIRSGESTLDASLITGETLPVTVRTGDTVCSGMINLGGTLEIEVGKAADDSMVGEIIKLMEKAEQGQSAYVRLADRAARLYTPVVHMLAVLTFTGWLLYGMPWQPALLIAATVLIITCPCALGLAVPVVQVVATGELMKRGIMVKSGDALERLAAIDTLLLDKTGTLTLGQPVLASADHTPVDLQLAASLAVHSRHPLSRAIADAYSGPLLALTVTELPGQGLKAVFDGAEVRLGSRSWCGVEAPEDGAGPELWLSSPDRKPVRFAFTDPVRPDALDTLRQLKSEGLALEVLSGDRAQTVETVATGLELATARGGLAPAEKYARLEELRQQGHRVGMAGDGLNDAPTLARADVSLSPASALDLVQNTADIVFTGTKLSPLLTALRTARQSQTLIRQNFAISVLYNLFAIPLAMAGLVTPAIAALAMSGSSLLVIANALRLRSCR